VGLYIFAAVAAAGALAVAAVTNNPAPDEPLPMSEADAERAAG
jgi:hypothetical protein